MFKKYILYFRNIAGIRYQYGGCNIKSLEGEWFMSKFENVGSVLVLIMVLLSVFLFSKFPESNKVITIIATILLLSGFSLSGWFYYFSKIDQLRLSVFMTLITIVSVMLSLYILKLIKVIPPYSTLIAIGTAKAIANILIKNSTKLENILNKFLLIIIKNLIRKIFIIMASGSEYDFL